MNESFLVAATLLGPILAVQAQKWVERATETRRRKFQIFFALMATRATRVAPEHVQALNMIDLEFSGNKTWFLKGPSSKEKRVLDAWKNYSDLLNQPAGQESAQITAWVNKSEDLFVALMYELSKALGYSFDEVQIRRGVYHPQALSETELTQKSILKNLSKVLNGEQAIPMKVTEFPNTQEAYDLQINVQKLIQKAFSPEGSLSVAIKEPGKKK